MIIIHWDFSTGEELSYDEGLQALKRGESFATHCLDFFTTENEAFVVRKDGSYIESIGLLENTGVYTNKIMRKSHNIQKMLKADAFKWVKSDEIRRLR